MACLVLGEIDRLHDFLRMDTDITGLNIEKQALPKRIKRMPRPSLRQETDPPPSETPARHDIAYEDTLVGF